MRNFLAVAALCVASVGAWASEPWEAILQARDLDANGTADAYFDVAQNITWLADANYAATSGYLPAVTPHTHLDYDYGAWVPGYMYWHAGMTWAESLTLGNVDGWRLSGAAYKPPVDGIQCVSFGCSLASSELNTLYSQLAGLSADAGPFINIQGSYYFSLGTGGWRAQGTFGAGVGSLVSETGIISAGAWAVHDGDVGTAIAPIPEPSTYALMVAGLAALAVMRRRKR